MLPSYLRNALGDYFAIPLVSLHPEISSTRLSSGAYSRCPIVARVLECNVLIGGGRVRVGGSKLFDESAFVRRFLMFIKTLCVGLLACLWALCHTKGRRSTGATRARW